MPGVHRFVSTLAGLALVITGLACAADSGAGTGGGGGGSTGRGSDGGAAGGDEGEITHAQCTDALDNDGDGRGDCADEGCAIWVECGGSGTGDADGGGLDECASVVSEARETLAPVDIILIVDSSGSMSEEADIVQMNINDFAADISASGVDYHVVMITDSRFVTVPPPLGTDAERFLFIDQPVGSHESLEVLLSRYDDYAPFLRAGAATHFGVVTDDESDMGEVEFRTMMEAQLGQTFRFHAVASPDETHCDPFGFICGLPGCDGPHGEAADVGARYYSLAGMTEGTTFSICASDWSPLWTTLRESVVVSAMLPCYYELPEPPAGEVFDVDRVNVSYTDPSGTETVLPRAIDEARCNDATGTPVRAWHYDDNDTPTQIILCPAACDLFESAGDGARVDIALGCDTEMVLI